MSEQNESSPDSPERRDEPNGTPETGDPAIGGGEESGAGDGPESRQPEPPPRRRRSGSARFVVFLTFILALGAAAGVGWLYWEREGDRTDDALAGLEAGLQAELETAASERQGMRRDLDALTGAVDDLSGRFEEVLAAGEVLELIDRAAGRLEGELDSLAADLSGFRGEVRERLRALDGRMDEAIAELEAAGGQLSQADRELALRAALIEARSLVALGIDRLELAGDLDAARRAWRRALERLERIDDPRVGSVRRTLAGELETLEATERPDWAARVGQFQALAEGVSGWPARSGDAAPETEPAVGEGWWARLGASLGRLVSVREREGAGPGPAEIEQARARARMALTTASLAAARGEQALVETLVAGVESEIESYFEPEAMAPVRRRLARAAAAPEEHALPRPQQGLRELDRLLEAAR